MRIYKVHYVTHSDNSEGFSFHANAKDASDRLKKFEKEKGEDYIDEDIEIIDIAPTKKAIIALLNEHGSHPDNG